MQRTTLLLCQTANQYKNCQALTDHKVQHFGRYRALNSSAIPSPSFSPLNRAVGSMW